MRFDDREQAAESRQETADGSNGQARIDLALNMQAASAEAAPPANVVRIVPGPDAIVTLPPGTGLDAVSVVGRDLVVTLPDGTQWIIVDGAVFVPQLVIDNVQVPPGNLAALLVGQEIEPAAGPPQSSGGNFEIPVGGIGDPFDLGDLLPPTDLSFGQPEERELDFPFPLDEPPEVVVVTPDNPAGATMATVTVNEAALPARGNEPAGSNPASDAETAAGTIVINSGDGPFTVAINGVAVTSVGQTFTSPSGVLTITSIGETTIGFSYTLTDNLLNGTTDTFAITVTDVDGDTAAGNLTVNVLDDAPIARDDSAAPAEDTPVTINVFANDTPGADGVNLATGVALGTAPGKGTVVYNGDGTFTYTPTPGETGTDSFTYTITDGDGETATATVTITLAADSVPTIDVGANATVSEAALASGSNPGSNAETATGSFAIATGNDSVTSLVVNGVNVTNGGTVTGAFGTLTVTLSNGTYSYSYTLTTNSSGNDTSDDFTVVVTDSDGDTATDTLAIDIVDDVPTARNDVDSVAEDGSVADGNVLTGSGGSDSNATDGVADTQGADGAAVTGVAFGGTSGSVGSALSGAYGTLTLNANGSYSYAVNNGLAVVQGLSAGETLTETFSYTITDGDGDASTATLSITIQGADDGVSIIGLGGNQVTVDEDDLPGGTDTSPDSLSQSGTFDVAAPDGIAAISIGDQTFTFAQLANSGTTNLVIDSPAGVLVINGYSGTAAGGTLSYTYTLQDPVANAAGSNSASESFAVVVTDEDGSTANASLDVTIVDDQPIANNDSNSIGEDASSVGGNVLTNDVAGADGGKTVTTTGTFNGTYGTLTLNADGSYTYTLNNSLPAVQGLSAGETLTETFDYGMRDSDFDADSATLTITIQGANDGVSIIGLGGNQVTVDEDDLPGGTDQSDPLSQSGTFDVAAPDGIATISIGGQSFTFAQLANSGTTNLVIDSPAGVLVINGYSGTSAGGTVSYTYTLQAPVANAAGSNSASETFAVVVTDEDGSTANASLDVTIIDDQPIAANDSNSIGEDASNVGGNVLTNDVAGADGGKTVTTTGTFNGTYGTLQLNADGSYTYTLNNSLPAVQGLSAGETLTETFDYTMRDSDFDPSSATLTITIEGADDGVSIIGLGGNQVTVDEDDLPGGTDQSDPLSQSGTFDVEALDGIATISIGGQSFTFAQLANSGTVNLVIDSPAGVLVINGYTGTAAGGTVSYTYTLQDPVANGMGSDQATENFAVVVTDEDGSTANASLEVTIIDDQPIANDDANSLSEDDADVSGNVLTNDVAGADGGKVVTTTGSFDGTYGTLQLNADGSYTYTLSNDPAVQAIIQGLSAGETLTDTFNYTMRDSDFDPDSALLTITIEGADDGVSIIGLAGNQVTVDEDDLPGGTDTTPESLSQDGTFDIEAADGIATITIEGQTFTFAQLTNSGTVNLVIDSPAGVLVINGYSGSATGGTVSYTYTLQDPVANAMGEDQATESFEVIVTDTDGSMATANLDVTIIDDEPIAMDDANSISEDAASVDGNVLTNDVAGADGGKTVTTTGTFNGTYGTLQLNADGSYTYTLNNSLPAVQGLSAGETLVEVFPYTMRDSDFDPSNASLTITIEGADDGVSIIGLGGNQVTVDEDDLPNGTDQSDPLSQSGTFDVTAPDGIATISIGGQSFTFAQLANSGTTNLVIDSPAGVLVINGYSGTAAGGTVSYTYTLQDPVANAMGEDQATESFEVIVTDTDGSMATANLDVTIIDDQPIAMDDGNTIGEDGTSVDGNVLTNDVEGADGGKVVTTTGTFNGTYGTLQLNADGSYTYTLNNSLPAVQALDDGETLVDTFDYDMRDSDFDVDTATLTITIEGANDAPTVLNSHVWMSSDPSEQGPEYLNGYPLNVPMPTDVDGDDLVVTAANAPTGVFYFDGTTYVALTTGTVLVDSANGINLLDDLVYRPTATADDVVDLTLNLAVSDGDVTVSQSVFIHEATPTRLPGQNVQIGDGSSPLTSGNDQVQNFTLNADFAAGLQGNLDIAVLEVFTDFQRAPFNVPIPADERDPTTFGANNAGSAREREVQVEVRINGNRFVVVEDDTSAATFEQSWFFDADSGLMKATVSYTNIFLLDGSGNATTTTLADYLTANPPQGGDIWTVTYFDNDGGNFQARLVRFEFKYDDAGNPSITVNGDPDLPDTIYGTSGDDTLTGNGGNDTIYGRGGDDVINGGDGDDTISGGTGDDTIDGGAGTDVVTDSEPGDTITNVPPVVLDLDGDGLEFVGLNAGIVFDYDGDGQAERTAWVGPDDGLLAYDANGDRVVNDGSEIVFAASGGSDLEGLRQRFDTDGDGKLTAADAEFGKFGVWQDANSNGVTDAGEFRSLSELGIVSIDLTSDGAARTEAGGDVHVSGESSYTRADGSQGIVGDVSFATLPARQSEDAQKAAQAGGTQALTSSLVAAGLVATAGAAAASPARSLDGAETDGGGDLTGKLSDTTEFRAHAPRGEAREFIAEEPAGREPSQADAGPSTFGASDDAADVTAGVDGWKEAATEPSELLSDSAEPSAAARPDIGAMVEMAALPAIPQGLQPVGDAPDAALGEVLADAIQSSDPAADIDALLDALPTGEASGPAEMADAGPMAGEAFVADWGGMNMTQMFDMASASADAAMAAHHA